MHVQFNYLRSAAPQFAQGTAVFYTETYIGGVAHIIKEGEQHTSRTTPHRPFTLWTNSFPFCPDVQYVRICLQTLGAITFYAVYWLT